MTDHLSLIPWAWGRLRRRASYAARIFGGKLNVWHLDLGIALMPKRAGDVDEARGPVWPALVVIALLVLGLASAGSLGGDVLRGVLPHRENRP